MIGYAAYRDEAMVLQKIVRLDGLAKKYPWQLSGGMQQRLAAPRPDSQAVAADARVPCGALDAFTREELRDELQAI